MFKSVLDAAAPQSVLDDRLGSIFQTKAMCTLDSSGRDSTIELDLRCQVLICTKTKVALELCFTENGGSEIFAVLELHVHVHAVKTCSLKQAAKRSEELALLVKNSTYACLWRYNCVNWKCF